ncbi:MAG: hypothetical protein RLZZ210_1829 [Pseudomonadota bacterium]
MTKRKKIDNNNKSSTIIQHVKPIEPKAQIETDIEEKSLNQEILVLEEQENISAKTESKNQKTKKSNKNSTIIKLIALFFALLAIITSIFVGLWQVIPFSQDYISKFLSNRTNLNIKIGSIHTSWGNWKPRIIIYDIKVYDKKVASKLWFSADNIDLLFNNYSKYGFILPTLNFTYINLNKPYILSEQTKNGWITFDKKPSKEPLESLPNWLFQQELISINNANFDMLSLSGKHLPINFNINLKKHNEINYLSYANFNLLGVKADIKALFSPIYKKQEFLGYFKNWQGKNSIQVNLDLNQENIAYYKEFLKADDVNNLLGDVKQIQGEIKSNLKWKKTTVEKAGIDVDFNNINGKLPNSIQELMPTLKAHISLNTVNNEKLSKAKTNYTEAQEAFISKYGKDLPNQNYIWNIDYIKWNDKNTSADNAYKIENIIISHPTHNLYPVSISLQKSNLSPFNDIITRTTLPSKYQQLIKYLKPKAEINNLQLLYLPNSNNSSHKLLQYAINADIDNIQFNSLPSMTNIDNKKPANQSNQNYQSNTVSMLGKNGFNLRLQGTFENGLSKITAKDVVLNLPNSKQNLVLKSADTELKWNIANQISIEANKINFVTDEINLDAQAIYEKKLNQLADIKSNGNISIKNINLLNKFLPDNLSEHTKQIIQSMDIDASVNQAKFAISGNENQFKNHLDGVKIDINVPIQNAKFTIPHVEHTASNTSSNITANNSNISPIPTSNTKDINNKSSSVTQDNHTNYNNQSVTWPRFENIKGNLSINNQKMHIKVDSATAGTLNIGKTDILLNSFTQNPTLIVNAESNSSLESMLNYVNTSPVHIWISKLDFKTTGNANLKLNLVLPFLDLHNSTVDGIVNVENSDIQFISSLPTFKQVKSLIKFNHKGFAFEQASANFMGEGITASGYSKEHEIFINGDGILSKEGLEATGFKSSLSRIPKYLQGQTPYKTSLKIANHKIKVDVDTNLVGLGILLPEPLAKNATDSKPLHFSWELTNPENHIEKIKLTYNNFVGAILEQQRVNGEAKNIRGIYYADANFDEDIGLPDEGIQAKVNLKYINADAWRNFYSNLQKDLNNHKTYKEQTDAAQEEAELYLPARIAAYTQSLRAMDREIKNIIMGISRQDDGWNGNISSSHINGYIKIYPTSSKNINGLIEGHFSQVNIPDKEQKQIITELFQEKIQDLPALNIKIDNFTMLQKALGKVRINTYNEYTDSKKTWHIKNLSLENNDAHLSAKGYWNYTINKNRINSAKSQTNIDVDLSLKNVGNLLNLLGMTQVIKNGEGNLKANLEWQGSPIEFNYPSLNSSIKMGLNDGIILKVDPAAAKLLGIVSLQGLGNILTFNWNKLFAQGSPFDEIQSDASIKNGILSTNNFKLASPQAKVTLVGSLDLINETQNLQADIFPKINAGSASLAYSLINPAIGLGTLIAQVALANPLSKILKQSYLVTGKWDKPKVKKVTNYNNDDEDDSKSTELFSK